MHEYMNAFVGTGATKQPAGARLVSCECTFVCVCACIDIHDAPSQQNQAPATSELAAGAQVPRL
jgi:hypothetical protein